jgi:hypothetical protein
LSETPDIGDLAKLDFKSLKNKSVNTADGKLLGIIDSINNDYIIVKNKISKKMYYQIPLNKFNRWDGYTLWLRIPEVETAQHIMSEADLYDTKSNPKQEAVTFRLNENIMNGIRAEAENRSASINSFINYILQRFLESDKIEQMSGMVYINRPVVMEIFNRKSDEEVINLAKSTAKNAIYDIFLFTMGKNDLNSFLLWLENEMNKHSFNVHHLIDGDEHTYIIRHETGQKFSLYYKTIIEEIFRDHFKKQVDFTISQEILLFKFESSK